MTVVLKATVKKWPDFADFESLIGYTKRLYFRASHKAKIAQFWPIFADVGAFRSPTR